MIILLIYTSSLKNNCQITAARSGFSLVRSVASAQEKPTACRYLNFLDEQTVLLPKFPADPFHSVFPKLLSPMFLNFPNCYASKVKHLHNLSTPRQFCLINERIELFIDRSHNSAFSRRPSARTAQKLCGDCLLFLTEETDHNTHSGLTVSFAI